MQRGDIIVFKVSNDRMFVKRVIALPGETVKVAGDQVYINGAPLREPYLKAAIEGAASKGSTYNVRDYAEHTVPEGCYFVLGDNRSNSSDSRDLGFVKREQIVGKVTSVNGSPLP
ncbi:signal peptidase I [Paenibacillus solanacearum]|uniref:signal peptidase I n=1 Tax=Paenibacillus solanacearum TaxID=2048548 RepID=UPI0031B9FA35